MTGTVRDVVRSFLIDSGVTKIFGNPGSTEMRFFKDWPDDLDYVVVPQEAPALAMADGYAQASGSVGVVMLHSAAGLGNALGSLFTAERNGTPLVVIAGQQTRSLLMHDPCLFARRPTEFPRPYVKFAVEAPRPQDVPTAIAQAFRYAQQAPTGPVFVSVSEDDWDAPAEPLPPRHLSKPLLPAGADLNRLIEMITVAARPVLVLGPKVATEGARGRVVELAETSCRPRCWWPRSPPDRPSPKTIRCSRVSFYPSPARSVPSSTIMTWSWSWGRPYSPITYPPAAYQ